MIPYIRNRSITVSFILLTLVLFIVMVKLGFWQLARAKEKQQWQQTLQNRSEQQALTADDLENLSSNINNNLTGYYLEINAVPVLGKLLFLDNQIYQGKVGYLVFQPLAVKNSNKWILLELGFISASARRNILPIVSEIKQTVKITGRIYQKQINPLSSSLNAESGWPKRIQNLNFLELENRLNQRLFHLVLQPQVSEVEKFSALSTLPHPWQPIPMPAIKHQGYALQWFSMAGVLLILMLIFVCNQGKKQTT